MTFDEFMNIMYMLKLLYEIDRERFFHIVDWNTFCFSSNEDYYFDAQYETALEISDSLFAYTAGEYYDRRGISITVFSDPLIEDYFRLAGEYGEASGVCEERNPYFQAAEEEMQRNFNFSYSLDWVLKGYAQPKRKYQSRFALFAYEDGYVDIYGMAIGLLRMYRFFQENVQELKETLAGKEALAA